MSALQPKRVAKLNHMAKKKLTTKNFDKVMDNLKKYFKEEIKGTGESKLFLMYFNNCLDDLAAEDAFGTEGQLDPRGDQRD